MKLYLAFIAYDVRLALRYRTAVILNYLFPIGIFVIFGEIFGTHRPPGATAAMTTAYTGTFLNLSLIIGALGNGLWGAGMRAVMERESGVLRRFRVAPISALPLLLSSIASGVALFLPLVFVLALLSFLRYGMGVPKAWPVLLLFLALGLIAFRSIGLIVAAVANSTQETTVLAQLLFMPMLILSGATVPLMFFPAWLRGISKFIPSHQLLKICQAVWLGWPSLQVTGLAITAMVVASVLGVFVSLKLFRWDKEEKIRPRAKLAVAAVLLPFLLLGAYQVSVGDTSEPWVPYTIAPGEHPGSPSSLPQSPPSR